MVLCSDPVSQGECAGHLCYCLETHPEDAGGRVASRGGRGPLVGRLRAAALGLWPLWLFFHLLLTFALLFPYDLGRKWGGKGGELLERPSDARWSDWDQLWDFPFSHVRAWFQ